MEAQQSLKWHVHSWGTWGWLETAVKGVGILVGLIAFTIASSAIPVEVSGIPHTIAILLAGILTLFVLVAVVLRFTQREIISLIFAIANALGHAGMLFFLVRGSVDNTLPIIFGLAYVFGELVKQRFLIVSGYTESGAQTPQMLMFSRGLMIVYIVFVVLAILS